MRRRRLIATLIFIAVAVVAFASGAAVVVASRIRQGPAGPAFTNAPPLSRSITCRSPALNGELPAMVYLPAGYRGGSARYPVVYFLHGLPATPSSYEDNSFVAQALPRGRRGAIVVAPQGARADGSDREYLDWDANEDWPQALTRDLVRCIDHRYRTIARRTGRALIGLSAGGYGAFNVGLRALNTFGAIESWSGYFAATDPAGDRVLDLGSVQANRAARVPSGPGLASALNSYPSLLAFYVGDQDARFLNMNRQYDAALTANHVRHIFRVYSGGHTVTLWQGQASRWLGMALRALADERAGLSPAHITAR